MPLVVAGVYRRVCWCAPLPGSFLIDCGTTVLIAMRRFGIDPNSIDMMLLSHLHGDHFGGLPFFLLDAQLISKRTRPLLIAGPPGTPQRCTQAMEVLFPGSSQVQQRFDVRFLELAPEHPAALGDVTVTPYVVQHASGAPPFALRIAYARQDHCLFWGYGMDRQPYSGRAGCRPVHRRSLFF